MKNILESLLFVILVKILLWLIPFGIVLLLLEQKQMASAASTYVILNIGSGFITYTWRVPVRMAFYPFWHAASVLFTKLLAVIILFAPLHLIYAYDNGDNLILVTCLLIVCIIVGTVVVLLWENNYPQQKNQDMHKEHLYGRK